MKCIQCWLSLLRVRHYVKNILIFLPLLFSKQLLNGDGRLWNVVWAFIAFSLLASAIYLFNDIRDKEKDKLHPTKRNRPIASGQVSEPMAWAAFALLLLIGACVAGYVSVCTSWLVLFVSALYIGLNILYSLRLKNVPVLEIGVLSAGFMMRVMLGGYAAHVEVSDWLYLTVLAASFYMGLGKRRNELQGNGNKGTRKVLRFYNRRFLDRNMYMFLSLAIAFYSLWSMAQKNGIIWTVPLVMLIAMRYSLIVEGASDGDPVELILKDKALLLLSVSYAMLMGYLLYCW